MVRAAEFPLSNRFAFAIETGDRAAFEQWRWSMAPLFDVEMPNTDEAPGFVVAGNGQYFADVSMARARSAATAFTRNARVIARTSIDAITVMAYTAGRHRFRAEGREIEVATGDIVMFDLTRPVEITATRYANLSLTVPRGLLEPLVSRIDRLHGLVLRNGAPLHAMLLNHLVQLAEHDAPLVAGAGRQIAEATAQLVAAAAESVRTGRARPLAESLLRRIRQEIDTHIADPALDPDWLAARFSMSRATLYRAFADYGGVREYIRSRRLLLAWRALSGPARDDRIGGLAARLGFSDQATFSRAFRAAYGLTPRDVIRLSQAGDLPPSDTATSLVQLNRWMKDGAPVPQ